MTEREAVFAQHPAPKELRRREAGAPKDVKRVDAAIAQIFRDVEQSRRIMSVLLQDSAPPAALASNGKTCGPAGYR
jgi:hypothetical protein